MKKRKNKSQKPALLIYILYRLPALAAADRKAPAQRTVFFRFLKTIAADQISEVANILLRIKPGESGDRKSVV